MLSTTQPPLPDEYPPLPKGTWEETHEAMEKWKISWQEWEQLTLQAAAA